MPNQSKITLSDYPLLEIFSYLPIQTLAKFRFFCKDWYRLITGPLILRPRSFLLLCPNNVKLACMVDPSCSTLIPTPINIPQERTRLIGSSNGLICLCSARNVSAPNENTLSYYYVCNPITRQTVEIERICLRNRSSWVITTNGFAFDASSKTYKIVCASYFSTNPEECTVEIHTLGSDRWRTVVNIPNARFYQQFHVFVNGALHLKLFYGGINRIGAIDIGTETVRVFEIPPLCDGIVTRYLVSLKGYLSMIDHGKAGEVYVWIMKEYGVNESWVKGYDLSNTYLCEDVSISPHEILKRMMNGSGLVVNGGYDGGQGYYDFENNKYRDTGFNGNSVDYDVFIHTGSLVSPKAQVLKNIGA